MYSNNITEANELPFKFYIGFQCPFSLVSAMVKHTEIVTKLESYLLLNTLHWVTELRFLMLQIFAAIIS